MAGKRAQDSHRVQAQGNPVMLRNIWQDAKHVAILGLRETEKSLVLTWDRARLPAWSSCHYFRIKCCSKRVDTPCPSLGSQNRRGAGPGDSEGHMAQQSLNLDSGALAKRAEDSHWVHDQGNPLMLRHVWNIWQDAKDCQTHGHLGTKSVLTWAHVGLAAWSVCHYFRVRCCSKRVDTPRPSLSSQ